MCECCGAHSHAVAHVLTIKCPDCEATITLKENLKVDDLVVCEGCGAELLVTKTEPELTLELIEEQK